MKMKKLIFLLCVAIIGTMVFNSCELLEDIGDKNNTSVCKIDSIVITEAEQTDEVEKYRYDESGKLMRVEYYSEGHLDYIDTIIYFENHIVAIERYNVFNTTPHEVTAINYTNGEITTLVNERNDGELTITTTTTITYDGNYVLSIEEISDNSNPEEDNYNKLDNFVYFNENIISADYTVGRTDGEQATIILNITYDNKNNLGKMRLIGSGVGDFIEQINQNNILSVEAAEDYPPDIAQGDKLVNRLSFNYNNKNNVTSYVEGISLFEETSKTYTITYYCN